MKGAIIGDIVGSIYEWHNIKTKDFPLFAPNCFFTDDSIMTLAVGRAFLNCTDEADFPEELVYQMRLFGHMYPHGGYGGRFKQWLRAEDPHPYNSFGNGAAMRCSPAGMIASSLEEAEDLGQRTAEVTHNHPEGIKAARVTAGLVYLGRKGRSMDELRAYAGAVYEIPTCDAIRSWYEFDETCQGTMPAVFAAFFDSTGFEDAIRNAISVGGDSDTIAAITGSIAEGYYGVPDALWKQARQFLPIRLDNVVRAFYKRYDLSIKQKKAPVGVPTGAFSCHPPNSSSFVSMSEGAQPRTVLPTLKSSNSTSYCSCVRLGYIL